PLQPPVRRHLHGSRRAVPASRVRQLSDPGAEADLLRARERPWRSHGAGQHRLPIVAAAGWHAGVRAHRPGPDQTLRRSGILVSSEGPVAESTQRIEAFSDGVFAIAITLLVLEIKVPH